VGHDRGQYCPDGSEGPCNALRLVDDLLVTGEWVDMFLMGDAVPAARRGQDPRGAHTSIEDLLRTALDKGAAVAACGTCCRTRGLEPADLVDGVRVATIHDLAELVKKCDEVVSF
jgi:sulfur relay (sulfurtransferase) complex TusBCD TusD component (DsrE family)